MSRKREESSRAPELEADEKRRGSSGSGANPHLLPTAEDTLRHLDMDAAIWGVGAVGVARGKGTEGVEQKIVRAEMDQALSSLSLADKEEMRFPFLDLPYDLQLEALSPLSPFEHLRLKCAAKALEDVTREALGRKIPVFVGGTGKRWAAIVTTVLVVWGSLHWDSQLLPPMPQTRTRFGC